MLELIKEIPVTFGPHKADWWMVGVTFASAAASAAVAFFAWRTSRDAKNLAEESDKTQRELHTKSLADEYSTRFNAAIAAFLRQVAAFREPIMSYLDECERVEISNRLDPATGELLYPPAPPLEAISIELEVMYLIADSTDYPVIEAIDSTLDSIANAQPYRQWPLLVQLLTTIRRWRSAVISFDETSAELSSIQDHAIAAVAPTQ